MIHILFWNPDISSVTTERMQDEMTEIVDWGGYFNWSFWEYENVHAGDVCYLVRCSDAKGPHGVVLRGLIASEPYQAEDWSGRGRKIFYADWYPQEFIDSEELPPLSPETLEALIPGQNWRGGHSGRPLQEQFAPILEKAWYDHIGQLVGKFGQGLYVNDRVRELTAETLRFWVRINATKGIPDTKKL